MQQDKEGKEQGCPCKEAERCRQLLMCGLFIVLPIPLPPVSHCHAVASGPYTEVQCA